MLSILRSCANVCLYNIKKCINIVNSVKKYLYNIIHGIISLILDQVPWTVTQIQYSDWPVEQDKPFSSQSFLALILQIEKQYEEGGGCGPIIAHCL